MSKKKSRRDAGAIGGAAGGIQAIDLQVGVQHDISRDGQVASDV